jgi:hypothetical protein
VNHTWFVTALTLGHVGHCTNAEAASTIGVSGVLAVLLFRPWRKVATVSARVTRIALPLVLAVAVTATGCGGGKPNSASSTNRPATDARIQIAQPTPNQVTAPDVTLVINLIGAKVVQPAKGKPRPDEGHIHVSLDGQLVSMAYTTTQDLHGVKPGSHTIQAEFVAIDHLPFKNRPLAFVQFTTQ